MSGQTRLEPASGGWQRRAGWNAAAAEAAAGWRWQFALRGMQPGASPGDPDRRTPKVARLEAVLFVAGGPLTTRKLAQHALLADAAEARALIDQLNASYERTAAAFRIEQVSTGWQLLTRPEFAPWLERLHRRKGELKLSPPALETLAIIAYRQPITRADIEAIRGVQSIEMLKQLMDRGLVRIVGEDDSLGRPYLYGTTRQFLELFGLRGLDELPMAEELRRRSDAPATPENSVEGEEPAPAAA